MSLKSFWRRGVLWRSQSLIYVLIWDQTAPKQKLPSYGCWSLAFVITPLKFLYKLLSWPHNRWVWCSQDRCTVEQYLQWTIHSNRMWFFVSGTRAEFTASNAAVPHRKRSGRDQISRIHPGSPTAVQTLLARKQMTLPLITCVFTKTLTLLKELSSLNAEFQTKRRAAGARQLLACKRCWMVKGNYQRANPQLVLTRRCSFKIEGNLL